MRISGSKPSIVAIVALLAVAAIVTLLSPSERVLGDAVKVVYVHGAMIWISLMLFAITGGLAATQLIRESGSRDSYLLAFEETATGFWFVSTVLGFLASYITWGGIIWAEPRIWMTIVIAALAGSIYYVSRLNRNLVLNRVLAVFLALTAGGLLINAGRIFHPENPIFQSEPIIQLAFATLAVIFFTTALLIVKVLSKPKQFTWLTQ
ncbi:MAG: hypothetical protein A3K61_01635 [Thaumarchaeota archaeon RBG_16_49_8]|nr:MAG: hypothetical protein A3K61_01635 [Thaumarchaeota archaeon RBG_16_49_8]